jgi:acyl-CoA thioester hydrolase
MMWFAHTLRVRYSETDQMGVVYHTNYLNWMEWARTELIRECGFPYRQIEERGLLLPVLEADLKFRLPARYDDVVTVFTRINVFTNVRLEFAYEIRRQSDLKKTGTGIGASTGTATGAYSAAADAHTGADSITGTGIGASTGTATGAYSAAAQTGADSIAGTEAYSAADADAHTGADSPTGSGIGSSTGTEAYSAAAAHTGADSATGTGIGTSIGINSGASTPEPAGELLVTGSTKHIWVSREWKPVRLDRAFPELFAVLPNIAESSS